MLRQNSQPQRIGNRMVIAKHRTSIAGPVRTLYGDSLTIQP